MKKKQNIDLAKIPPPPPKKGATAFKNLLSVACVGMILYLFTFYMDGEMGVILISFLLFAPLVSLFFAWYAKKRIRVTMTCDSFVSMGNTLKVKITVEKTGFFPLSIVEITPVFDCSYEKYFRTFKFSLIGDYSHTFDIELKPRLAGYSELSLGEVYSCGFLGFIKFRVTENISPDISVGIIPQIPEVKSSNQLFKSIADTVMTSDEEEESNSSVLFSANTTPGYEHREYVEGDPLKRVNWKLSTKKGKLMVRLDEAASSVQPLVLLDMYRNENCEKEPEECRLSEDILLRSVFGLLDILVKQGIACRIAYCGTDGNMVCDSIDSPETLSQILLKVISVKIIPEKRAGTDFLSDNNCALIWASTNFEDNISVITEKITDPENVSLITSAKESSNNTQYKMWFLDDDNNFKVV